MRGYENIPIGQYYLHTCGKLTVPTFALAHAGTADPVSTMVVIAEPIPFCERVALLFLLVTVAETSAVFDFALTTAQLVLHVAL